jgi:hypothetical protein
VPDIQKHPRFEEAQRHARAVRGFYTHALVYVLVNMGVAALALGTGNTRWGLGWGALGWGIGLAAHGASVFMFGGWLGPVWEQRKVREYLERHN